MSVVKAKLSASLEDYLEAIFNLAGADGSARSKDIAESLGVARASVTGALQMLRAKGLVNYKPYGSITLTEKGTAAAVEITKKHNILTDFYADVLGVNKDIAAATACRSEHTLGAEITSRLLLFVEFLHKKNQQQVIEKFRRYYNRKKKKYE
jgi:DtxR family Mn-dependent transcriptional regulator